MVRKLLFLMIVANLVLVGYAPAATPPDRYSKLSAATWKLMGK